MRAPLREILVPLIGQWGLIAASLFAYSLISESRGRRVGEMLGDPIMLAIIILVPLMFGLARYASEVRKSNG